MNRELEIIHKRNGLMVKVLWIALILIILPSFFVEQEGETLFVMLVIGTSLCSISTILYLRKIFIAQTMYFIVLGLYIMLYGMLLNDANTVTLTFLFFVFITSTLYQNWKVIIFTGVLYTTILVYAYYVYFEEIFYTVTNKTDIVYLVVGAFMITILAATQCNLNERMRKKAENNELEAESSKHKVEGILEEVKETVQVIQNFTIQFEKNLSETKRLSNETTHSFHDIARGMNEQLETISEINTSVSDLNKNIINVSTSSTETKHSSDKNVEIISFGNEATKDMANEFGSLNESIHKTVETIEELAKENKEIETIIHVIDDISNKVRLLSLNASIEAASSGEHGKGFAVVAEEIKKLAGMTKSSSSEIKTIVGNIQTKEKKALDQIELGLEIISRGKEKMDTVQQNFGEIKTNTNSVLKQVNKVESEAGEIKEFSQEITNKITNVYGISEEIDTTTNEVIKMLKEQEESFETVIKSFQDLRVQNDKLQKNI